MKGDNTIEDKIASFVEKTREARGDGNRPFPLEISSEAQNLIEEVERSPISQDQKKAFISELVFFVRSQNFSPKPRF